MFANPCEKCRRQILELLQLAFKQGQLGVDGRLLIDPVRNLKWIDYFSATIFVFRFSNCYTTFGRSSQKFSS